MDKRLITIFGLFALGILVGIAIMNARDDEQPSPVTRTGNVLLDADISPLPTSTPQVPGGNAYFGHIQTLEDKVADLEARVAELEQATASQSETSAEAPHSRVNARANRLNRLLTIKSLVKAGLSEDMAADMVRRKNNIELRKLELRDRAAREGYLGSKRYMDELSTLLAEETSLREDLGDDAYDRYLFANGQTNRVRVTSVMVGSSAELAGMKDGDLILTYGQSRIFEGLELKNATSEGELGEYVNVDISRDGQQMSLWVPRGALGVRLGATRIKP